MLFFFCFFFSRPFHENFKFLKNCPYDFHEILHSHSTPKGAPACAKASKSYGWHMRNIAKFSPKMAKKTSFFDFFDFLTNCSYDSNKSESEGKRLKPTPLPHMRLWFVKVLSDFVHWIVQKSEQKNGWLFSGLLRKDNCSFSVKISQIGIEIDRKPKI